MSRMEMYRKICLTENSLLKFKLLQKYKRKCRRKTTREIYRDRLHFGEFHHLYPQLRLDENTFYQYARMQISTFDYIVDQIRADCTHHITNFQTPISVEERLMLSLRYLSTGISFRQLAFSFRISKSSVASIVIEVCKAIWNSLQTLHMPVPNVNDFEKVADDFFETCNFPNCLGSLGGKRIRIKCPTKHFFSIVLIAIVDSKHRFLMIDVAAYGRDRNSAIYRNVENRCIVLPKDKELPNSELKAPFVFVADEAFPLRKYILRPYAREHIKDNEAASYFNYRLSRARMTVENAFRISSTKFRILLKSIETSVNNAVIITKAICVLHNIIIDKENAPRNVTDSSLNNHDLHVSRQQNHLTKEAKDNRNIFCQYFLQNKI